MSWLKRNSLSLLLVALALGYVTYQRYPAYVAASALEGRSIEQFTLRDIDGKTHAIPKKGTVLLNFWATWCMPCRVEMPGITRIHNELNPQGLTVLGISNEDSKTIQEYNKESQVSFPLLVDSTDQVHGAFGVRAYPTLVIVQDGVIQSVLTGISPLLSFQLRKRVTGSYF